MPLFFLVYVSSAREPFDRQALIDLLEKSRAANTAREVTGLLLYKDGNFMQMIEGPEESVRNLYAKICRDPRHRGFIELIQGEEEERQFPDWSMGFRDLGSAEERAASGYSPLLNSPFTGSEFTSNPSAAQKLLLSFKRTM